MGQHLDLGILIGVTRVEPGEMTTDGAESDSAICCVGFYSCFRDFTQSREPDSIPLFREVAFSGCVARR